MENLETTEIYLYIDSGNGYKLDSFTDNYAQSWSYGLWVVECRIRIRWRTTYHREIMLDYQKIVIIRTRVCI